MRFLTLSILLFTSSLSQATALLSVEKIANGIYVHYGQHELPDKHNHGAVANIGFIIGKKCVAVIDSGGSPQQGLALKKRIQRMTSVPICYVINTHVHPDHIYGNSAFKEGKVKFVGHYKLARAMTMRAPYYVDKAAEQLELTLTEADFIVPDIEVKHHLKLDLGGRVLTLTAHPTAHTDNDLSIYDAQTDTLWLGDLFFISHLPVIDGSLKGWLSEIDKLQQRTFKRVIPGHGVVATHWPAEIQAQKNYLKDLLTDIRLMIKQGKYLEEAVNEVKQHSTIKWQLFDEFHKRNVTTAFAELEWED